MNNFVLRRYDYYALLAFAFTAVASIALQNFIWISVVLFLFLHFKNSKKITWPFNLFTAATILFLATFLIGAIVGVNPAKSFQTVHKYLTFLVIFPLGAMALSLIDIRKLLYFFIAGASICAIFGIGKHFILHQDRIDSFSGDKMVFGGMLMVSLLLVVTFLKTGFKNPWFWISLGLISAALIFTQTRGAWVGFAIGFVLLTWRLNRNWLFIVAAILGLSFFVIPHTLQDRVKSIGHVWLNYDSHHQLVNAIPGRILIWVSGWRIIQDHPWGVGQGNLEDVYPKYKFAVMAEPTEPHLHNNFLQILAQNGWLGLTAYLFWIFTYYRESIRFKTVNSEVQDWNWTFLCLFSAILVWGLTEYTFSHQFMNVQFFLCGLQVALWKKSTLS